MTDSHLASVRPSQSRLSQDKYQTPLSNCAAVVTGRGSLLETRVKQEDDGICQRASFVPGPVIREGIWKGAAVNKKFC